MDLEFATTTRTGKLLEWLRADAAKIRNGSPSAEWPHPSLAAFVLAHGRPFAVDDFGSAQRRLARSLAATHWRVHGPFQHREPALNAQRCLLLDELERFVYPKALMLLCEAVIKLQPSSLGDIEIEPARLIWHGAHSPLTCAVPRQYFKRVGDVRVSVAAPLGTPEHEEQQRDRLARGIALPSDYDELGDDRVAELMGFSPPSSFNRPVRG